MESIKTTCGLDCPDACGIVATSQTIQADKDHPTSNGSLCAILNKYMLEEPRIKSAKIKGKEVSLEEALEAIAQKALDRKTGARGLRSIMEETLLDIMYELPELEGYEVIITEDVVLKHTKPLYIKDKKSA